MMPEHWDTYLFGLVDLSAGAARRRFRSSIKSEWGCCAYCGLTHESNGDPIILTLDHVRPKSFGGNSMRHNLVPSCRSCNADKGSERDWEAWFVRQDFYSEKRAARIKEWLKPYIYSELQQWNRDHAREDHAGTSLSSQESRARSSGDVQTRADRRVTRLLGGEISAKTDFSSEQSSSWLNVSSGRGRALLCPGV